MRLTPAPAMGCTHSSRVRYRISGPIPNAEINGLIRVDEYISERRIVAKYCDLRRCAPLLLRTTAVARPSWVLPFVQVLASPSGSCQR